jgi:hypothetical protein
MYKCSRTQRRTTAFHSLSLPRPIVMAVVLVVTLVLLFPFRAYAEVGSDVSEMPTVTYKPKIFERLWKVYPNKEAKEAAIQSWNKLQVSDEELDSMRAAFPLWTSSEEWTKQKGRYVPPLTKWLDERMWEKEPPPEAPLRIAEVSSFLIQPIYLAPRLAFALGGAIIAGVVYPWDQTFGESIWETSIGAPWVWHEFLSGG